MKPPRSLSEIAGNQSLLRLMTKGRIPQSALFTGPEGTGKRTVARLFAGFVNCRQPSGNDLCGGCSSCIKVLSGNHPDVREYLPVDGPSIRIEQMRELNQEVQYRPFEAKERFFLVDPADRMTLEAANCILKTLEEPPPTSHIFLITAYPDQLLPTIRSRCQILNFRPLSVEEIVGFLVSNTELERPDLRARFAGGSLGNALSMDLDGLLQTRDVLIELLEAWAEDPRFSTVFGFSETAGLTGRLKNRESVVQLLDMLQGICYDLHSLLTGMQDRLTSLDRKPRLTKLAGVLGEGTVRKLLELIAEAKRDIDRSVSPVICFETLWLQVLT